MIDEFLFNEALGWDHDKVMNTRVDELAHIFVRAVAYHKRRKK